MLLTSKSYLILTKLINIVKTKSADTREVFVKFRHCPHVNGIINLNFKVQMKSFFLLLNLKEQQKSGRLPFTIL